MDDKLKNAQIPVGAEQQEADGFDEVDELVSKKEQLKILALKGKARKERFQAYIEENFLCEEVEVKLFKLKEPDRTEFLEMYIKKWSFGTEGDLMLFKLKEPERTKFLELYVSKWRFSPSVEVQMFTLPKTLRNKLLKMYVTKRCFMSDEALYEMSCLREKGELIKSYLENHPKDKSRVERICGVFEK